MLTTVVVRGGPAFVLVTVIVDAWQGLVIETVEVSVSVLVNVLPWPARRINTAGSDVTEMEAYPS